MESLRSLPDEQLEGLSTLRIGGPVWHPLRVLVDDFLLVFVRESPQSAVLRRSRCCRPASPAVSAAFKQLDAAWHMCDQGVQPLPSQHQARRVLASLRSATAPPMVAVFRDSAGQASYLGQFMRPTPDDGEVFSVLNVSNLGFKAAEERASPSMQPPAGVASVRVDASYELLGQVKPDRDDDMLLPAALLYALVSWEHPGNGLTLRPLAAERAAPRHCVICVGGSPITEAAAGAAWPALDLSLGTLEALGSVDEDTRAAAAAVTEAEAQNWSARVDAFIRMHSVKAATDLASSKVSKFRTNGKESSGRLDVDFTETMWALLECAPSGVHAVQAVTRVLGAVAESDVIPFIHTDNDTALGEHIRRAIAQIRAKHFGSGVRRQSADGDCGGPDGASHGAAEEEQDKWDAAARELLPPTAAAEGLIADRTRDMLVELGSWKLERDIVHLLSGLVRDASTIVQPLLRSSEQDDQSARRLDRVCALRDVAQVVAIAGCLKVPPEELRALARVAVAAQLAALATSRLEQRRCTMEERFPVYAIPLSSMVPWLSFAGAGRSALPLPIEWRARATGPGSDAWVAILAQASVTERFDSEAQESNPAEANGEHSPMYVALAGTTSVRRLSGC